MNELQRIADQIRRSWQGEAWSGPSVRETLEGVTAAHAVQKPLKNGHSIWELVLHLTTWSKVARRRFEGESFEVTEAEDWPPVGDSGEGAWRIALADLEQANNDLVASLETAAKTASSDARLNELAPGKDHTIYVLLHGTAQHNLYHAGQISLLKKALG
ncbi:MAG: DinB family protein [Acidobacteriaceae bacterium]|nr:DinB family protein [Acidobacteriaceae bacterium]